MNLVLKNLHNFSQKHDYNICIYQKVRNIKHLVNMLKSLPHIKAKDISAMHFCQALWKLWSAAALAEIPGEVWGLSVTVFPQSEYCLNPTPLIVLPIEKVTMEMIFEIDKQKGKELSFFSWAIRWSPLCNDQGGLACPVSKAAEAADHCTGYLILGIRYWCLLSKALDQIESQWFSLE